MSIQSFLRRGIRHPDQFIKRLHRELSHRLDDSHRFLFQRHLWSVPTNKKEVRFIGLRRSGNHAVINWMRLQEPGAFKHLNNLKVDVNPYRYKYEHLRDYYPQYQDEIHRLKSPAQGKFNPLDFLVCSYEDYGLREVTNSAFDILHDLYLGQSEERFDVLILRDPFNLFASRLKSNMMQVHARGKTMVDLWIDYAREFLGETQYLTHQKIVINYNQWVSDRDYRETLANRLQIVFTDAGIDRVSGCGGGSSFEGMSQTGRARNMPLFSRWQAFSDHPDYQALFQNRTLIEYSEAIFGRIPGTECLFQ